VAELIYLYDSKFSKNYLAYGSYKNLITHLNFRLGLRNVLDKFFLRFQSLLPTTVAPDAKANIVFNSISNHFHLVDAMIMFDTSWYKDALYIGVIETNKQKYFFKSFSTSEEVIYQGHAAKFAEQYFADDFYIIPVIATVGVTLISPFIVRKAAAPDVEKNILALSEKLIKHTTTFKLVSDIIPIDFKHVLLKSGKETQLSSISKWLESQSMEIPIIPVHGDMTPWNMFVDTQNRIVLSDYETAGWHIGYYDYFHYLLQPIALKENTTSIFDIKHEVSDPLSKPLLCLYLIDQVYQHLVTYNKTLPNISLNNLIHNKMRWLLELINEK
jgi:hypothetical protein